MSVIAARGLRGPCRSDGARRCFMHSNREEEGERERGRGRGERREGEEEAGFFFFPETLLFHLLSPPLLLFLSSSSLGRISRVSLEGKCNNAPTRWNRARSIISREMDGPCRAGGGHARTQFRFNKLAKQDPQSDLSLTRRRCLPLRC